MSTEKKESVWSRLWSFSDMVNTCCGLCVWCFDENQQLIGASCPENEDFLLFLRMGQCLEQAIAAPEMHNAPLLMEDSIGMLWTSDYLINDTGKELYIVMGPVFDTQASIHLLDDTLRRINLSVTLTAALLEKLHRVPIMTTTNFSQYINMLHWTLTGVAIPADSVRMQYHTNHTTEKPGEKSALENPERSHLNEKHLLDLVRTGNLHYKEALSYATKTSPRNWSSGRSGLRQYKNTVIIFTALCARAAIDGGLPPATANIVQQRYTVMAENCQHYTDLVALHAQMIEDFIRRVHALQADNYSRPIRECCDYIHLHLNDPISLADLAREVGYTEYYLTKKFHKETGIRLVDYLRDARLEQACEALRSTHKSLQQISEELQFGSCNYFGKVFTKKYGISPAAYRQQILTAQK